MTSKIKVDNINKVSDDSNIINKCGTTITLGASGDSIALASGASQTGFGRTGTVDWQTGDIKTATFTAANGEGYFCNTAGGAFTCNLPAGVAGNIVSVQDYNNTFDSFSLTIAPNGSEKINGGSPGGSLILATEGQGLTLVYIDSTVGWRAIEEQSYAAQGSDEIVASGGTVTTSGDYKIHTFTGPGTFTVCAVSGTPANNTVSYLVVAGGGGGGGAQSFGGAAAGGGGAGGFREYRAPVSGCYAVSPLNGNPGGTAVTVTATAYPINVGGGGTTPSGDGIGGNGNPSVFSTVTSTAGGGGAGILSTSPVCGNVASPGGSGGGSGADKCSPGSGNSPPTTPSQGNDGGSGTQGGGGGGATAVGGPATGTQAGGTGATTSINATPTAYAGGGGGGNGSYPGGPGGTGGGGAGGNPGPNPGGNGTDNTGGGGGGGPTNDSALGGTGGSGIVIIRYKYQ